MAPRSLCHTTAVAPVPAFLGGSCPLGCSLSAPATGGLSMVSPQSKRYAAVSKEEKGAGGRLHGDTIAQSFLFCNGAVSGWRGGACCGLRRYPARSTLRRFPEQGAPPVPPAGAAPPAPCLGERGWEVPPGGAVPNYCSAPGQRTCAGRCDHLVRVSTGGQMLAGYHRVIVLSRMLTFLNLLKWYCPLPRRGAVACRVVKNTVASRSAPGDDGELKGVGVGRHRAEQPFVMHSVCRHPI